MMLSGFDIALVRRIIIITTVLTNESAYKAHLSCPDTILLGTSDSTRKFKRSISLSSHVSVFIRRAGKPTMPLSQLPQMERRKFTFNWWGKHPTATKLNVVEEEKAVRIDTKLHRSYNQRRSWWKPKNSADHNDKLPQIGPPKFEGWSGASTGGQYLDEASALSNLLLVDRDRYQQIQNDKRVRLASEGNAAAVHQLGAMATTGQLASKPLLQSTVGEHSRLDALTFPFGVTENGNVSASENDSTRARVSPISAAQSMMNTPESKYVPFVAKTSHKIESYDPLPSSSAPSLEDISLYDGSTSVPHSSARTFMKHATNAALYDGSSWGPASPRTTERKVLHVDEQVAIEERLTKNRANRLSLPPALRYNPSQRSSDSEPTWPREQHGTLITSPPKSTNAETNPFATEFRLSLVSPSLDGPFTGESAIPSASSSPMSTENVSLGPTGTSTAANSRDLTQHRPESLSSGLAVPNRGAQRVSNGRANFIMTDAQLVGQRFAVPYRSHSAIHKRDLHSSVRQRRGLKSKLSIEIIKPRPRNIREGISRAT